MARVLFVDDDAQLCRSVVRYLRDSHTVVTASSVAEAKRALDIHSFHIVFLDLFMPEGSGETLLPRLQQLDPSPVIAVISAHPDAMHRLQLSGWRGVVLPKPIQPHVIRQVIEQAEAKAARSHNPADAISDEKLDRQLLAEFSAKATKRPLSRREGQVVERCFAGQTIKEIAPELGVKLSTARMYLERAEKKADCRTVGQLMASVARFAVRRKPPQ